MISVESVEKVMRTNKIITEEKMPRFFIKLFHQIL